MYKRGQVTIFIIIAILVIAIVALFFIFKDKIGEKEPAITEVTNPNAFLKSCIKDAVEETIEILSFQGGYMENPLSINFKFGNEPFWDISYLCYPDSSDLYCRIQGPLIINRMERELGQELSKENELEFCFKDLKQSYIDKGYLVTSSQYNKFEANLIENKLIIELDAKLTMTKAGQTLILKEFKMEFPTKLYNLGKIADKIVEQESEYGSFDTTEYAENINYKVSYEPSDTKIYTIENRKTKEKFRFAIKIK